MEFDKSKILMRNINETASYFKVKPRVIRDWLFKGYLKGVKVGNRVYIPYEEIKRLEDQTRGLVTREQIAKFYNVKPKTIDAWVLKGKLVPAKKFMKRNWFEVPK